MVFDGMATISADQARQTAQINFSDGGKAYVHPKLKVMHVTAPGGINCSLHSRQGAPYHRALCDDEEAARQFAELLGQRPEELLGRPTHEPEGPSPRVESLHLVDIYV